MAKWGFSRRKPKESWPADGAGQPVAPAFLTHVGGSQIDMQIVLSLLEAYGIPTVTQYPNDGVFGKIILGHAGGGIDIFVPETMLEEARDILSAEAADEDDPEQAL